MSDIHNKGRWHSNGCLLYFRGGHRGNLHEKGPHPSMGVLCYLAMESVILFGTVEELKCASCSLVDVMQLQNDAIMLKTLAPLEAHIATFTMVWHLKPTIGDGEPHTPP